MTLGKLQVLRCGSGGEGQPSLMQKRKIEVQLVNQQPLVGSKGSVALGLCGDDPRPSAEEGTVLLQQLVCYPLLKQNHSTTELYL